MFLSLLFSLYLYFKSGIITHISFCRWIFIFNKWQTPFDVTNINLVILAILLYLYYNMSTTCYHVFIHLILPTILWGGYIFIFQVRNGVIERVNELPKITHLQVQDLGFEPRRPHSKEHTLNHHTTFCLSIIFIKATNVCANILSESHWQIFMLFPSAWYFLKLIN